MKRITTAIMSALLVGSLAGCSTPRAGGVAAAREVAASPVTVGGLVPASIPPRGEIAGALRVDVAERPPRSRAHGYVINDSSYRITAVRLRVDGTDPDGQVLEPAYGWVPGDIPGLGGRGWFNVVVPPNAERYAISVTSFDMVAPERSQAP